MGQDVQGQVMAFYEKIKALPNKELEDVQGIGPIGTTGIHLRTYPREVSFVTSGIGSAVMTMTMLAIFCS